MPRGLLRDRQAYLHSCARLCLFVSRWWVQRACCYVMVHVCLPVRACVCVCVSVCLRVCGCICVSTCVWMCSVLCAYLFLCHDHRHSRLVKLRTTRSAHHLCVTHTHTHTPEGITQLNCTTRARTNECTQGEVIKGCYTPADCTCYRCCVLHTCKHTFLSYSRYPVLTLSGASCAAAASPTPQ